MSWPAIRRIRLAQKARRRVAPRLFAVAVALIALLPVAQPAHAHADTSAICILTSSGPICPPSYPPPALLDLNQTLYAATPAQAASLQVLETQAISDVLTLHGLAPADAGAVQSWGRADAEGELFALLLQALNTAATARTADQQNAVAWLAAVDQRQAIAAAQAAGREYVKWAGLDQGAYQALLNRNASESDLQAFLSTAPDNYNNPDIGLATGGWCVYRSPAPYSTEYTGYTDVTCHNQCPFICNPPTPSYDQFVTWGEADADYPWLSAPDFGTAAQAEAASLGVGVPLAAAAFAAPLGSVVAAQIASAAALDALDGVLAAAGGGSAGAGAGAGGAAAVEAGVAEGVSVSAEGAGALTVVIVALVTAVIEGVTVVNAAKLPGQLAALITGAETTPLDPAALESTSNGLGLFGLFVGATLPVPDNRTCDNAASPAGSFTVVAGGVTSIGFNVPCLNATDIPASSGADPLFLVQAKGATTPSASPTITWKDAASGTTTTARLSESWFIAQANGATVQTLRLAYTDWAGAERTAWLVGNPTDGYIFVTLAASSTAVDPSTCVADGTCSFGPSIDYVGPDGQDYSASVQAYTPPTGAPSYPTPVEGSPVTFAANGYAPGAAAQPITYTWEFEQTGCGMGFGAGSGSVTVLCPNWDALAQLGSSLTPDYTAPVAGATATHTYPTSGQYLVRLTATDATGKQAVDTFTVAVGDVPPALALAPACPLASPCVSQTGDVGMALTLGGTITQAGPQDSALVVVNWGDGSGADIGSVGPLRIPAQGGSPLALTPDASHTHVTLSDAHTYATGGTYHATVSVFDQGGGTASQTVVETIRNPAPTTQSLALTSAPPVSCLLASLPGVTILPPAPAVAAIGSSPVVTITGGGFVPDSTVRWDGAPLATTYVSPCQLTAQVPATDTASATVGALTVVNAAPGGGASNPQVLYITPQGNLAAAALATSADGSAAAVVGGHSNLIGGVGLPGTPGTLSVVASGAGAVALAQYSADPLATIPPAAVNAYFDVFVPAGSDFSTMQVTDCNLGGGSMVSSYDATTQQWTPVSGQTYNAGAGCVSFTLDGGSAPSLSQLARAGGAVFGVRNVPPVVTDPGPQSVPYGGPVSIPVAATDVEPADKLMLRASGLPAGLSLHDNGDGTGTVSGTITAPVGVYTATLSANDGYSDATPVTVAFTVKAAPLTITADAQRTVYGQPLPPFTVTPSGLVNGDTLASLQGTLNVATTATQTSAPGTYALTPSGLSAPNYSISYGAGTLTIAKDASTLTLASSANPAPFGQPVTFTATVAAAAPGSGTPIGTVTFLDGGTPIGTTTLKNGQASLTTATLLGGTHTLSVSYGGDANFTGATSATLAQAITFSRTVNGTVSGPLTIHSGETVLIDGTVNGPLNVQTGGAVALVGAHVGGPLSASGAGAVALCGSAVTGPVSLNGSAGLVRIGASSDDPGVSCAGDTLAGPLSLSGNKGGVEVEGAHIAGPLSLTNSAGGAPGEDSAAPEVEGNTIGGSLSCSGNTPPPTADGHPNTVSGPKSGQCAGL